METILAKLNQVGLEGPGLLMLDEQLGKGNKDIYERLWKFTIAFKFVKNKLLDSCNLCPNMVL